MSLKIRLHCGFFVTAHWNQVSQGNEWTIRAKSTSVADKEILVRCVPTQVPLSSGAQADVLASQLECTPSVRLLWGLKADDVPKGFIVGSGVDADLRASHPAIATEHFLIVGRGPEATPFQLINLGEQSSLALHRNQQAFGLEKQSSTLLQSGDFIVLEPGIFWMRVTIEEEGPAASISLV